MKQRNPVSHRGRRPVSSPADRSRSEPAPSSTSGRDPWAQDVEDGLRGLTLTDGRPVPLPDAAVQALVQETGESWRAWEDLRAAPKRKPLSIVESKTRAIASAAKELVRALDAASSTDVRLYREIAHEFEDTYLAGAVAPHGIDLYTLHRPVRMLADITEKRAAHYEAHKAKKPRKGDKLQPGTSGKPASLRNQYRDTLAQRIAAILRDHGIAISSTTPTSGLAYGGTFYFVADLLFEKCKAGTPNADLLAKAIRAVKRPSPDLAPPARSS